MSKVNINIDTSYAGWDDPQSAYFVVMQSGVPVLAEGIPGIGKTAQHLPFARRLGREFILMIGSCRAPEDFGGLPVPNNDEGYVVMMPTQWAHRASNTPCLVLFDEITTVTPSTQAPMLSTFSDRMSGDTRLHPQTLLAAACNPAEMATNGSPLSKAMANRFYHHKWKINTKAWRAGLTSNPPLTWPEPTFPILPENWGDHVLTYASLVSGFIAKAPDRLACVPTNDDEMAFPTPRSWTHLIKALAAAASVGAPDDTKRQVMEGLVGRAVSVEFSQYIHYLDLADPEAVLSGEAEWEWDAERIDRNEAFLCALFVAIKNRSNAERWERGMELLMAAAKACPEAALLHMSEALECKPAKAVPSKGLLKDMAALRERCKV